MKTNITKTNTIRCFTVSNAWSNITTDVDITVNDAAHETVNILFETNNASFSITVSPEEARTFAGMIYEVANCVKNEWSCCVNDEWSWSELLKKKAKKPLTKAKK